MCFLTPLQHYKIGISAHSLCPWRHNIPKKGYYLKIENWEKLTCFRKCDRQPFGQILGFLKFAQMSIFIVFSRAFGFQSRSQEGDNFVDKIHFICIVIFGFFVLEVSQKGTFLQFLEGWVFFCQNPFLEMLFFFLFFFFFFFFFLFFLFFFLLLFFFFFCLLLLLLLLLLFSSLSNFHLLSFLLQNSIAAAFLGHGY